MVSARALDRGAELTGQATEVPQTTVVHFGGECSVSRWNSCSANLAWPQPNAKFTCKGINKSERSEQSLAPLPSATLRSPAGGGSGLASRGISARLRFRNSLGVSERGGVIGHPLAKGARRRSNDVGHGGGYERRATDRRTPGGEQRHAERTAS